jgi:hypothetical protein
VIRGARHRQARDLDAMAWIVAHLLVGGGTLQKGTRVDQLMRGLLGREPGTVPGEMPVEPDRRPDELSPEASVAYMAAWVKARHGTPTTERRRA